MLKVVERSTAFFYVLCCFFGNGIFCILMIPFIASIIKNGFHATSLARRAVTHYKAVQRVPELSGLIRKVYQAQPATLVEIGTRHGGTFSCWPYVCNKDAILVSVDLPSGAFGGGAAQGVESAMLQLKQTAQQMKFIREDSHSDSCESAVRRAIEGNVVDFLFIDGDHSLAGVREDFNRFSALVRNDGLIAFHDIIPDSSNPHLQVHEFWKEIKNQYETWEFIWPSLRRDGGMGIGVLRYKSD